MAGSLKDDLLALSRDIHADPELAYQEHRAAERIAGLLRRHGHVVETAIGGLATAFRARVGPPGPAVALLAEYDALPEIGHACGHNLIDAGVFRHTVAALSSHPSGGVAWECGTTSLGVVVKRVGYRGAAAHAAYSPHEGRNALNGVIRLFVGVDGWRQHLPGDARVHGIVSKGGAAQNIVPEFAEAVFGLRARTIEELRGMEKTFGDIAQGAALQTGTEVAMTDEMRLYAPTKPNPRMTALLMDEMRQRGLDPQTGDVVMASTDFGNVSQAVPADYIGFPVNAQPIPGHSHVMREASASDLAHRSAFTVIDVLASAAVRIATDASLRSELMRGR